MFSEHVSQQTAFAAAYKAAREIATGLGYVGYEADIIAQGAGNAAMHGDATPEDVHEAIAHFRVADGGRETVLIAEAAYRAAMNA